MLAEAIAHELIAELSRLRWLFVTARASSFRLGGDRVDPEAAGRLLGVRYCVTGTLELDAARLVLGVEVVDARDGGIVWADRQSAAPGDVHALRAELVARLLAALEIRIPVHEAARARLAVSEDLDAWSAYHLGLQHMFRFNRSDNREAAALFERAVALDPGFARAHAGRSFVHFQNAFLSQTEDVERERRLARECAARGLELDPIDPFVNFTMGRSYWLEGDLAGSVPWLERATSACPNYAQGVYARGWTASLSGDALAGRAQVDLALRLSPLDPLRYAMEGTRAFTHIALGEDRAAADWADRAARSPGAHVLIAAIAAAAHALAGDEAAAQAWSARVRERRPSLTRADFFVAFPMRDEAMRGRLEEALTRSGL
jgi:TolB-like protein